MGRIYRIIVIFIFCGIWPTGNLSADTLSADTIEFYRALEQRRTALEAFSRGASVEAQDSLIAAYETFMRLHRYDWASMCLYERAIEYMNIGELGNMEHLLAELRILAEDISYPESNDDALSGNTVILYNYYSVASAYYAQLDSAELAIDYGAKSIRFLELIPNPHHWRIIPVWSYYNQALFYDLYFSPPRTDSIEFYLARAEAAADQLWNENNKREALISILDLRSWLLFYRQDYQQARLTMEHVLALIDTVAQESPNTIIVERGEAYAFMVELCTEQKKYDEALIWQQRLTENNALRYNIDKAQALQEVETRYEVEKQQLLLDRLSAHNLAFRRLLYLVLSMLISAVLLATVFYLRKKNAEERLYEAALEADDMRSALMDISSRTDAAPMRILLDNLIFSVKQLPATTDYRDAVLENLRKLDPSEWTLLFAKAKRLTMMDKRYILCFAAGMTVEQVSHLFHIEEASVYTVRYRLRKKFPKDALPFLSSL